MTDRQSLSRIISPEKPASPGALREVVERASPQRPAQSASASGEVIPTALNAFGPARPDGKVIGGIGSCATCGSWTSPRLRRELDQNAPTRWFVSDLEGKIFAERRGFP